MRDTPEAEEALANVLIMFEKTHMRLQVGSLSRKAQFYLLGNFVCTAKRLLEKHALPKKQQGQHYDATIWDDVVTDRNKPYRGSDSVPF
jgi:hypothetical protein